MALSANSPNSVHARLLAILPPKITRKTDYVVMNPQSAPISIPREDRARRINERPDHVFQMAGEPRKKPHHPPPWRSREKTGKIENPPALRSTVGHRKIRARRRPSLLICSAPQLAEKDRGKWRGRGGHRR